VVVGYHKDYLDEQIQKIPATVREQYEVIKTRDNLLEFMPKGITKAYGISLLAKDLGIEQEEVMCIGDEENDLPMIEYAGIGVAMANAISRVKEIADVVTDSNEEDGVAKVVEKYVLR
jgi:Cof subfamily protein (haloacid dehalogenase superfamily)